LRRIHNRVRQDPSVPRSQSFVYDATGNLTAKGAVISGNLANYVYTIDAASNRLTAIANLGIGYSFDAAGNLINDGRISWTYNARGRMTRAVVTSGATTQTFNYLLNGLNLRVRKTGPSTVVPQGTRIFVYDDGGQLLGEYDNLGRARMEHVWLGERPIAAITYTYSGSNLTPLTTTVSTVETDHLATPRLISNSAKQARWSWHSAPYGDTLPNENPAGLGVYSYNLRFAGQYFDADTNLAYNHHRDYDSTSGRYVQSDPIGLGGGANTYFYVGGKPSINVDPLGLEVEIGVRKFHPYPVPYARHCFVRFNGNNRDTLSFTRQGVAQDENPGGATYFSTRGTENDACVRQEMQKCRGEEYKFTSFNCCMCASNALDACGLEKVGSWPNAPRDASNPPFPKALPTMPPVLAP
jgi:RHS repeat-associated protein